MPKSRKKIKNYFNRRFGVRKEIFNQYNFYKKSNSIWCTSKEINTIGYKNIKIRGIRALRETNLGKKPTTYFLQLIGKQLQKNIYKLNKKEFEKIIRKRKTLEDQKFGYGYIAFTYQDKIIGCGLQDKDGIKTQIPKGRTNILKNYTKKI